jgi:hypothetical protein
MSGGLIKKRDLKATECTEFCVCPLKMVALHGFEPRTCGL